MKNLVMFLVIWVSSMLQAQELKKVVYTDGKQKLNGLISSNTDKKRPGVLILPAWKGIDNEARQAAVHLINEGYIVFIADIYGEGNVPTDNESAAKIATQYKTDYKAYQHRIMLVLEELQRQGADKDNIAVIGYCFGGTGALESARGRLPIKGVVCIHGGLAKANSRANEKLTAKILIEHPAEDKSVSAADYNNIIQEMNAGNADWQIITYAQCGHTFTNPESSDYNEVMAKRAWKHTLMFLEELFFGLK